MSAMGVDGGSALVDQVYEALYEAIADLRLPAGQRVNVDQVARDLAVSPTPVREALARLEMQHIVRKRHRVGYVAAELMTLSELQQLFALRQHIEPWLTAEAARRVRDDDVEFPDLAARAGSDANVLVGAQVHDRIAELSGQRSARRALLAVGSHLHVQRCYANAGSTVAESGEHDDVVAAVRLGDPEGAGAAMSRHLQAAEARLTALFPPRPGD